jgi:hypothetical protein
VLQASSCARDSDALRRAIITASPHVVIDQLTDLARPNATVPFSQSPNLPV